MKLKEISEYLGCRLAGNGELSITGVTGIEQAWPGELTFLSHPRYRTLLSQTQASAVIVGSDIEDLPQARLISENPYFDFARALEMFYRPPRPPVGIHPKAEVSSSARISENASIGAYAVIGDNVVIGRSAVIHPYVMIYESAHIGDDFLAHSHAVVREFCEIGDRVVLQNGVVIGADGYGFAQQDDGTHYKIVQSGKVVIEDDVEIQAHSCIDRAAVGETRIKRGSKVDNLVQIGHAVVVGENAIICSQSGIAGSTILGNNCILAGQVGIINQIL